MATLEQIEAKMKNLKAQAEALLAKKVQAAVDQIRKLMLEHGLTIADIEAQAKSKRAAKGLKVSSTVGKTKVVLRVKEAVAPKYQHPKTRATWSGRGRAPAWIANVKDRSKFLISGGAGATAATTAGSASKAKIAVKKTSKSVKATAGMGQRKGPQPAMYRDPKSGATWSGRGRAPAWLAGAKERTTFLIDGGAAMGAPEAGAVSNAGKPKVAGKKAAARKSTVMDASAAKKAVAGKKAPAKRPAVKKVAAKKVGSANAISSNTDSTVAPAASAVLSA